MSYLTNVALGFDAFVNAITGGDPDSTLSLRTAQAKDAGKWWGRAGCVILTHIFRTNHCLDQESSEEAIEDRGSA